MNKELISSILKRSIYGILIVAVFLSIVVYTSNFDVVFEGQNFCTDKGHDSVSLGGTYSEKFGKVKCISCYDGECIYEEFNVTKKFGIIVEEKQ